MSAPFGEKLLRQLNCNHYGYTFEAATMGPHGTVWVSIMGQEAEDTERIRWIDRDIPVGYNNVLIPTEDGSFPLFASLPYTVKYICV